jgi:hypothetical protein
MFLLLLCTEAIASEDADTEKISIKLESMILQLSEFGAHEAFSGFMVNDENFIMIDEIISKNGEISAARCFNGHSSELFFYFICHVTYQKHSSGNGLHFYVFKEGSEYLGTRFGISDFYAKENQCLIDVAISKGLSAELSYRAVEC